MNLNPVSRSVRAITGLLLLTVAALFGWPVHALAAVDVQTPVPHGAVTKLAQDGHVLSNGLSGCVQPASVDACVVTKPVVHAEQSAWKRWIDWVSWDNSLYIIGLVATIWILVCGTSLGPSTTNDPPFWSAASLEYRRNGPSRRSFPYNSSDPY